MSLLAIRSNTRVKIGSRTRIQSHSFICEMVEIGGNDCFIGHSVVFINDTFSSGGPAGGDESRWKQTKVGDRVSIGGNATILPVSICDDTVIGAGAVITKDILEPGFYTGNPAEEIAWFGLKLKGSDNELPSANSGFIRPI